jgi:hypothetical protein
VRTVENLSLPRQQVSRSDWARHLHLRDLPISEFDEQPMILIGQDNIHVIVARKVYQGPQDAPIATKTHLGWILHGPVQQKMVSKPTPSTYVTMNTLTTTCMRF